MARTPTWKELWLDAAELAKIQKQCFDDVHQLLHSLPELDQKLEYLHCYGKQQFHHVVTKEIYAQHKQSRGQNLLDKSFSTDEIHLLGKLYPGREPFNMSHHHQQPEFTNEVERSDKREEPYYVEISDFGQKARKVHKLSHQHKDLEHLKPLPMPLSEYLKLNRPDMVMRADRRAMYLKRKAERRKFNASTRTINALEQMRLSRGSNYSQPHPRLPRSQSHTYSVKCKLSEQEMRRLTAKTYKRLPEVKSKRKEEVSNHMKVQNYKNKLEYGRKLLENRRHGIINYPLRASYDDNSLSSQDIFSMNGYGRAADAAPDPYY